MKDNYQKGKPYPSCSSKKLPFILTKEKQQTPKDFGELIDKHIDNQDDMANKMKLEIQKGKEDLQNAASAFFRIPVFFSHQGLHSLETKEQHFIVRMFKEIEKVLLFPRTLPTTEQYPNTTLENVRRIVNSSYGCAAALLQPKSPTSDNEPYTPFLQFEPAMAFQYGLPLLLVIQRKRVDDTYVPQAGGIWKFAPYTPIEWFSNDVTVNQFFDSVQWKEALQMWAGQVRSGYFIQTNPDFEYECDH